MPTLAPVVNATTTTEVKILPTVKRRLLGELKAYEELKFQAKALDLAMEKHKAAIATIRESIGATTLDVDGFKVTYVSPVRSVLEKKLLLDNGVTMAQIESATVTKPTKPYTKISLPGEGE